MRCARESGPVVGFLGAAEVLAGSPGAWARARRPAGAWASGGSRSGPPRSRSARRGRRAKRASSTAAGGAVGRHEPIPPLSGPASSSPGWTNSTRRAGLSTRRPAVAVQGLSGALRGYSADRGPDRLARMACTAISRGRSTRSTPGRRHRGAASTGSCSWGRSPPPRSDPFPRSPPLCGPTRGRGRAGGPRRRAAERPRRALRRGCGPGWHPAGRCRPALRHRPARPAPARRAAPAR